MDMWETNYVNKVFDNMVQSNEPAFVSACIAYTKSTEYHASIVYFPRKNKGLFIFSDKNHVVLNSGDVSWTSKGQWDMGELEGGMQTIKIWL
ncbi:MAG TPA: hypothetical protein VND01_00835 [Candidatus Acidoferrales bacterium]|nr:hypothetical protein [Candidatus Acidoferrales bacterium]